MRVFVAGGAGVMGRRLVVQLVARGHQVTAAQRPAQFPAPRAAHRRHQPAAHRGNGPPAGSRRGDRRLAHRGAECRQLDRSRRGWTGE
ncbi:MAG: hypothetical protein K0R13_3607 [Propionibacteriaceae bacterium]|nr:hypothetical protein [Propionibacteriaceae bacterium]